MHSRAKDLIGRSSRLFTKRQTLLSLWQEIADNFYPQRADFTVFRTLGEDFASNLTTSYPVLIQRSLSETLSGMLRPTTENWFHISIADEDLLDNAGKAWLEQAEKVMRRAMYQKSAQFVRATKQGDADFVTFGQAVLSTKLNRNRDALLYQNWHLRDVAWQENDEGAIDTVFRKWKPTVRDLMRLFPKAVSEKIKEANDKEPDNTVQCIHIVLPAEDYETDKGPDGGKWTTPFVSIYVDIENETVLEEVGMNHMEYTIPRWQTVSGSQYAYSPCTVAALPDARLIQAMSLVLLEVGEKAANPPMIAQNDVIRSDVSVYAGGLTWVDEAYDERLGSALRPIPMDTSGIPFGLEMRADIKEQIMEAFYINKLNLPQASGDMTAFEVSQRVQEYIRGALPLFEPMETDYNGALCEQTFEVLMANGAFGSVFDMPESLRGQEIRFTFESPLHEAVDKQKAQTFLETKAMLAEAAELEPSAALIVDARVAIREVLEGIGTPATWIKSESDIEAAQAEMKKKQSQMQMMEQVQAGGAAAEQAGKAVEAMKDVDMGGA